MTTPWERFKQAARLEEPDPVPVGLIVDSPWLPGYAGMDTRDYFLFPDQWLEINLGLLDRFPEAVRALRLWHESVVSQGPASLHRASRHRPGLLGRGETRRPAGSRSDAPSLAPLRGHGGTPAS